MGRQVPGRRVMRVNAEMIALGPSASRPADGTIADFLDCRSGNEPLRIKWQRHFLLC